MNEYLKSKNETVLNTSNPWWNVNDLMNIETVDNANIESSYVETEAAQINADKRAGFDDLYEQMLAL